MSPVSRKPSPAAYRLRHDDARRRNRSWATRKARTGKAQRARLSRRLGVSMIASKGDYALVRAKRPPQ